MRWIGIPPARACSPALATTTRCACGSPCCHNTPPFLLFLLRVKGTAWGVTLTLRALMLVLAVPVSMIVGVVMVVVVVMVMVMRLPLPPPPPLLLLLRAAEACCGGEREEQVGGLTAPRYRRLLRPLLLRLLHRRLLLLLLRLLLPRPEMSAVVAGDVSVQLVGATELTRRMGPRLARGDQLWEAAVVVVVVVVMGVEAAAAAVGDTLAFSAGEEERGKTVVTRLRSMLLAAQEARPAKTGGGASGRTALRRDSCGTGALTRKSTTTGVSRRE